MDVRVVGGFRTTGVDDHQCPFGVITNLLQQRPRPVDAIANERILADQHRSLRVVQFRVGQATNHAAHHPGQPGFLLGNGVTHVFHAQRPAQTQRGRTDEMVTLGAAAIVKNTLPPGESIGKRVRVALFW
jgi:hypothetical protein